MTIINKDLRSNGKEQAGQNVSANLQLLPLIMNKIPQAVFWKDKNLVFLGCNRAFAEDAGFDSPEDVVGKTDFDMPWKDQAELYRADDQLILQKGEPKINYEEPQTTPDGSIIWLRTSKIPVQENGQTIAVLGMYENITPHKQAEKILQESEATLSAALAVAQMGYWEFDLATQLFTFNDQYYSLHGTTAQEVGGYQMSVQRFAQEFVYPEDGATVGQATQQAIETTDPNFQVQIEARILRKNGEVRWATVWFRIQKDAQGRTIKLHGVNQDITERKQAVEALQKREENFRAIADFTYGWETWLNPEGNFLYVSPACERISGYAPSDFIQNPRLFSEITHPDDRALIENHLHDHKSTAETKPIEFRIITKSGRVCWISHSCQAIHDSTGTWQGRRGSNFDITERKRTEEFLKQSEATLSSALRVAQMGHWEYDIPTQMFTFNDQYYSLHGRTAQELGGYQMSVQKFAQQFVYPEDAPSVGAATQQAIETTDPDFHVQTEARVLHADGKPRWVTIWFRIEKDAQGRTIKLHGVNQDITARKELEAQVRQAFERRGLQVQLSTQVSQSIASAASLEELYERVVTQVKEQFGYYHTQLLRYDSAQEAVMLVTGYGEVGVKMLAAGHRLPMGEGLIGTAAATGETVLRPTLESDPDWHPNPLLPQTRGEIAVPIKLGNTILGVLDVQSNVAGALNTDDQLLLEGLCGQIAIAIESTRLRQDMVEKLEEINRLYRALSHESWETYREGQDIATGFMFDHAGLRPVKDVELADEVFANIPLVVPGGEVIGNLAIAEDPQRPMSPDDENFIQQVSEQLALALESARLFEQTEQQRGQLNEALNIARLANWEYDVKRDRFIFNDHFYSIFHTTAQEVGGYEVSSAEYAVRFVHPDDVPMVGQEIGKALSSTDRHYNTHLEHRILFADGGVGYISVDVHIERDEQGNILRYYGANQDITERKRAEEIIAQRATQLATVASLSNTTSTLLDPDKLLQTVVDLTKERFGLYHVHIYLADESWKTLLLAAGAGEIGRQMVADGWNIPMDHDQSIVASAARNRESVIANDVVRNTSSAFLSNQLLPDTRSEMAVPMVIGQKLLGVFDVQADTAGYFSEEDVNVYTTLAAQVAVALQNARLYVEQAATLTQLRELDKLKSSFLANMSHELRTPLNSILGFTDVMLEELDGPLTEHMDNDLRLIQKNGQHLLHLINDVLDMAKIEAGRMNLNPENFNALEVLEEVTSITSTLASEKNLSLYIQEDSEKDVKIYADRTRLRQVMINLVNNSIKFTDKGKVILNLSRIDGARVLISVKDTGIGIPTEKLEAIFQEFTQVDSSSTRKAGGTGLGLPISRRLVEMHGGRLWAESIGIPGEGSTFFVELPIEARITEVVEKQAN